MANDNRYRRTLRLSPETRALLKEMKDKFKVSENYIIERSIRKFSDSRPEVQLSVGQRVERIEEQLLLVSEKIDCLIDEIRQSERYRGEHTVKVKRRKSK